MMSSAPGFSSRARSGPARIAHHGLLAPASSLADADYRLSQRSPGSLEVLPIGLIARFLKNPHHRDQQPDPLRVAGQHANAQPDAGILHLGYR